MMNRRLMRELNNPALAVLRSTGETVLPGRFGFPRRYDDTKRGWAAAEKKSSDLNNEGMTTEVIQGVCGLYIKVTE